MNLVASKKRIKEDKKLKIFGKEQKFDAFRFTIKVAAFLSIALFLLTKLVLN